jgi:hypothetical protein
MGNNILGGGGGNSFAQMLAINAAQQQADAISRQQAQVQAQTNAEQQKQSVAIQQQVSTDTWDVMRQFGQVAAWKTASGGVAGMSPPMSTTAGGFATPIATQSGTPANVR